MSEILLGQSYFLKFDSKLWAAQQPYPPLGTLYAASYLRQNGHSVAIFDAMLAESEDEWDQALIRHSPRIAVLYEDNFNYLSKMCLLRMRQAAFTMMEMACKRGCTVIVGGADATDNAPEYLAHGADYVLLGEGEITLGELLDFLTGRSAAPLESIRGFAHLRMGGRGDIRDITPFLGKDSAPVDYHLRRPLIKDLDSLPFPAWDLVDIPRYRQIWLRYHGYFSMNMATTRGCPYHCNWCAKPIWGQRYNQRSPENVIAELSCLKDAYHPDHIWFVDDIFGLRPGWIQRFAELVENSGIDLEFKCLNRADLLLRDGEIRALAKAGCRTVWLGAESGSQKILDAMEKGIQVEQIRVAASRLHEAGIQVGFFLQFGYPGETAADIEQTFDLVRSSQPDDIGISVSYPLPGTKFYHAVKEQLGVRKNWIESDDLAMLYQGPFTTKYYRQLHILLHKEFRARKAGRWLSSCLHRQNGDGQKEIIKKTAQWLYYNVTLPFDRWKLHRLEKVPHEGIQPLPASLSPQAASMPTPQNE
jgi:anaerobic magnesium-protoporphyrin IX monomethyl ester cyclase